MYARNYLRLLMVLYYSESNIFQRIILIINRIIGGISREENSITGRLAPASCAIRAITLDAIE